MKLFITMIVGKIIKMLIKKFKISVISYVFININNKENIFGDKENSLIEIFGNYALIEDLRIEDKFLEKAKQNLKDKGYKL